MMMMLCCQNQEGKSGPLVETAALSIQRCVGHPVCSSDWLLRWEGGHSEWRGVVSGSTEWALVIWSADRFNSSDQGDREIDEVCVWLLNCSMKQCGSWCSVLVAPSSEVLQHTQSKHMMIDDDQHNTYLVLNTQHTSMIIHDTIAKTQTQTHNPLYWSVNIV